jgi:uncharacterized coiled-coil DUF342 family protein
LAENEFQSKIRQSEEVISSLKKQLEAKKEELKRNFETQKQMRATIDGLKKTRRANKRAIQELREKQKKLQETIDDQTKTLEPVVST